LSKAFGLIISRTACFLRNRNYQSPQFNPLRREYGDCSNRANFRLGAATMFGCLHTMHLIGQISYIDGGNSFFS